MWYYKTNHNTDFRVRETLTCISSPPQSASLLPLKVLEDVQMMDMQVSHTQGTLAGWWFPFSTEPQNYWF